jgi:urease accessory protein
MASSRPSRHGTAPLTPAPDGGDGDAPQLAAALARLRLHQLISPALPVGAFSYSEGLEVLVQAGRLTDAAGMETWLRAELERGGLRLEAAALPPLMQLLQHWCGRAEGADPRAGDTAATATAAAAAGTAETLRQLCDLDGWLLAQREAPELRAQQRQMGGSLLQLLADLGWPLPQPLTLAWPTAFAWAGVCLELPAAQLIEAYLYGWVANQLSAAVRLVPLGPTEAQRLQLRLAPVIAAQAGLLACSDPQELWSGGVGAGLAQLGHGQLYSRLFRS